MVPRVNKIPCHVFIQTPPYALYLYCNITGFQWQPLAVYTLYRFMNLYLVSMVDPEISILQISQFFSVSGKELIKVINVVWREMPEDKTPLGQAKHCFV